MDEFFKGLGIAVGVFVGVIGGTGVVLLTQWVNEKRTEGQRRRSLKFEFDLNIKKIDGWLDQFTKYRNAINANNPALFAGWFDLSRVVYNTANDMFARGELYKYLDHDDIGELQETFWELSQYGENYLNNLIAQHRANFDQAEAARTIDFWEDKFKRHKQTFHRIVEKLP